MKKITFLLFFIPALLHPQTIYKTVNSAILNQTRELKIQLPRQYDENSQKSYPLILTLDGDYLFAPLVGNVMYFSFWNKMPASIVVGVNQARFREMDTSCDKTTSFPTKDGTAFYDFLKNELLPHMKESYRTNDFAVIIGHGSTANFINYFLLEDPELFDAYINLSPDYAARMKTMITKKLIQVKNPLWYYLAISKNDFQPAKNTALHFNEQLNALNNKNLHLHFANFKDENYYSAIGYALPAALERVFLSYAPISQKECKEAILQENSLCDYLLNKYETIEDVYGWKPTIKTVDFMTIAAAIEKNKKWEEYDRLSKIAKKNVPETVLEGHFEARYFEETGKPKKAFQSYERAFQKKEISFVTKNMIKEKMHQLKLDSGL